MSTQAPSRQVPSFPFEATQHIRDACLCLHVQRAARVLARAFDDALRPCGLTNGQFSLLNALNRPAPPSIAPVANLLAMDRTTLTAALKPLVRRGLVIVEADPDDRRSRLLRLTNEGHRRLAQAAPLWNHVHGALEARLGQQAEALRKALAALA
jgi:DNA-binding MarR family transcriptional regulator